MKNVQLDWTFINALIKSEKFILIIIKKESKIINDFWCSTFTSFIDQFECYVFLKDINSRYISANKNFLNLYHFKNRQEIISKTDYDLCWTREESNLYIQDDKQVIEQKKSLTLIHETQTHQQTRIKKTLVTSKYPLYADPENIIGLIGFYIFLEKNTDVAILRFIDSQWKDYNQHQKDKYHEYIYEDTKVMWFYEE